jgi:hypothetical protein
MLGARAETQAGEMDASRWPDIVEAIQANLQPGPEQEFFTNAIEHLRLGNYRYALLEAVICLEIVMTQFIRTYLSQKGIPNTRINKFVSDKLGLTARVAALLNLTLDQPPHPDYISTALRAIEWRNKVVHGTGRLPNRPDHEIREGITTVLGIARVLALALEELEAAPDMQRISQELDAELGKPLSRLAPGVKGRGQHRVVVDFPYITLSAVPTEEEMGRQVERVSELLTVRDAGFDRNRHLLVRFVVLPNDVRARWFGGELLHTPRSPD